MPPKITESGDCMVWHPGNGDSGYCISYAGGGWMPGKYDSVKSALAGFQCCMIDESRFVKEIQEPINNVNKGNREITITDINAFYIGSKEDDEK